MNHTAVHTNDSAAQGEQTGSFAKKRERKRERESLYSSVKHAMDCDDDWDMLGEDGNLNQADDDGWGVDSEMFTTKLSGVSATLRKKAAEMARQIRKDKSSSRLPFMYVVCSLIRLCDSYFIYSISIGNLCIFVCILGDLSLILIFSYLVPIV